MLDADSRFPLTAIVYADGRRFETFLRELTLVMAGRGLQLAGLIQHSLEQTGRLKCDMYLQDLATGAFHGISEDRGPLARGCVLDPDRLLRACEAAQAGLAAECDLLVLCKFGKSEAEGGGFRSLVARALELSVPVLIGVPQINLAPFREFAAGFAREVDVAELSSPATAADFLREVAEGEAATIRAA